MRNFSRLPIPEFLEKNFNRWTRQWLNLKNSKPGAQFQWYKYRGKSVNTLLAPVLESQTLKHCSYCDAFPLGPASRTIDHFKPKGNSNYAHLAYYWGNLYWACADCQKLKLEQFDDLLLAPDDENYSFDKYFTYNYKTHEIEITSDCSEYDESRANYTCNIIFQLNESSRIDSRRMAFERWFSSETERALDDFAFRFIFDLLI